jgi:hypothetical protein
MNMKKMILGSVLALGTLTMNAQNVVVEGGGFWDNWSMGIQGGGTMKMSGTDNSEYSSEANRVR